MSRFDDFMEGEGEDLFLLAGMLGIPLLVAVTIFLALWKVWDLIS